MIQGITGTGRVIVSNSYSGTYVSPNSNNPMQGIIRLNGSQMEVYDGNTWIALAGSYPTIDLDSMTQSVLNWAVVKMEEERKWTELAKENTAVKIALDNLEQARQQLNITATLARDYETTS